MCRGGLVSIPGIFSWFSELKENVLLESCAPRNNTPPPPWSYPILFVLRCHWTTLIWHLCEWKYVIVNLLGRVYQAVKMMTLPGNKKSKENQKRKKTGKKNIIDSGNVLWWTWTDFEALRKLLHLLVVILYSVLVNSQCNLHHYENIVLKESHNYMDNITIISWPYFWINRTSLLDSDEDSFPPKIRYVICFLNLVPFYTVVVKLFDPNVTPESRVKEMITNFRSSWLLNKFSLSAP